jgi:predicted Zn finger-like uncharacterized protein
MILTCTSCDKKFVVPDSAITASGRMVQCGSCGNKWKQFPVKVIKKTQSVSTTKKTISKTRQIQQNKHNPKKAKKSSIRKTREINLYSPEYLAKKHGIRLNDEKIEKTSSNEKVSFGFYNSLLFMLVMIIFLSRGLYFLQDFVIQKLPFTDFYIDYFFESIRNMFEIWKNLITNY